MTLFSPIFLYFVERDTEKYMIACSYSHEIEGEMGPCVRRSSYLC